MTLKQKIKEYLENYHGATDSELEVVFNVRHQAVNSACRELVTKGVLKRIENPLKDNRICNYLTERVTDTTITVVKEGGIHMVPEPTTEEVEYYLKAWDELENYHLQEDALDKLFFELCPENKNITDILLKVATLNDFYSTNIFSVYPVAKHILSLEIDKRLEGGDVTLVDDIKRVTINGSDKNFYSFATKYCSHHRPLDFPIYDSYVEKVLVYFKKKDKFNKFKTADLRDYEKFKSVLISFRNYYGLDQYNLKQIDKYIWQLGKKYFPKNYKKKRGDK